MIGNPLLLGDDGYQISRSVRLRSSASAYFNRTPGSATNRKTWTWSAWVKRGSLGSYQRLLEVGSTTSDRTVIGFQNTNVLEFFNTVSASNLGLATTQVFRDPSAYYHIIVAMDTTQATAANRTKIYVNGVQITAFSSASYVSQNADTYVNAAVIHQIGANSASGDYFDGYLTDVYLIDGQALTPSSFGETDAVTGVWKPRRYTGTYGTNGFFLNFSDPSAATAAAIGKDYSGNGNNWTPNNISVTSGVTYDSMLDVPTLWADGGNGRGNYAVLNPLYRPSTQNAMSFRNANMEVGQAATNAVSSAAGTFAMSTGKWYWEVTVGGALTVSALGIQRDDNTAWRGGGTVLYRSDGQKQIGGTSSSYGATFTTNDVLGFAYDADAGTLTCYKNNVSQGAIYSSGAGNTWLACAHDDNAGAGVTYYHAFNFGQRPFAYTPPSGFRALNTQNLPEPTIKKGNQYFDVVLNTGSGTTRTDVIAFQPDLVWTKTRNTATNGFNIVQDSVRGAGNRLITDGTYAEGFDATYGSFTSTGFQFGSNVNVNTNGNTYVDWMWKEGATPGFDIVTYTGNGTARTIAHSLGVAPNMVIVKSRTSALFWRVYHAALGATRNVQLNTTNAFETLSTIWNDTAPTSSVFSVGTNNDVNANAGNYVAYLFSEVAGFSKFGSYTGNGSSDGPFVFCGFRPRWVMIKRADTGGSGWVILDSSRNPSNVANLNLYTNLSNAESTADYSDDFLSNGFKVRDAGSGQNANGGTYIYAAFAENPFKTSLAR